MARLAIYAHTTGQFLTELRAPMPRNYVLNGIGEATFSVASSSPKCLEEYLVAGNIVVAIHPKLPLWGGIIADDHDWGMSEIKIKCLDAAAILKTRYTMATDIYYGSAGSIIERMLTAAGHYRETLFTAGTIYNDGKQRQMQMGDSIYNHMLTLQRRTGSDWLITPVIADGRVTFRLDWLEQAGVDAPTILTEGANLERGSQPLSQRGPIINSIIGYTDASDPKKRLMYVGEDELSMGKYGVRQMKIVYSGLTTQEELIASVRADLAVRAWPLRATQFAALDKGNVFNDLRLGNRLQARFTTIGFSGLAAKIRVRGMKFNDRGRCELTGWQVYA